MSIDSFDAFLNSLPTVAREGFLVNAKLMPLSERTLLLPRQLAYYYNNNQPLGFVAGVSGRNQLPTANFCQDIRSWRIMLQRGGVSVIEGASFSGRAKQDHLRYANKVGYPVVLKPVVRNTLYEESIKNINTEEELKESFIASRVLKKNKASDLSASPYAMTRLSEDHIDERGHRFLPLGVRYMVEKQLAGQQLRLIIAHGEVVAAFYKDSKSDFWHTAASLHDSYKALGSKIANIMQGMAFIRVDLIVEDISDIVTDSNYSVVVLSEHLKLYEHFNEHSQQISSLLSYVTESNANVNMEDNVFQKYHIKLTGISNSERLKEELSVAAGNLGLALDIEDLDQVTGSVDFTIEGSAWAISALTWAYANGILNQEIPTSVDCQQHLNY